MNILEKIYQKSDRAKAKGAVDKREFKTRLLSLLRSVRYLTRKGKLTPMHSSNYERAIMDVLKILRRL